MQRTPPYTPPLYSKTRVYRGLLFLIFAQQHRLWVLVRTASLRRFLRVPTINVLSKNKKKYYIFSSENNQFYSREILQYIARTCLRNEYQSSVHRKRWSKCADVQAGLRLKMLFTYDKTDSVSYEPYHEKTCYFTNAKTKEIVQSLNFLIPKSQASSHLLWLYSLVCVGSGLKIPKTGSLVTRLI